MFGMVGELTQSVDKIIASEAPLDIVVLRREIERLEFAWLRAVRDAERSGEWQADGFVSTAAWVRAQCNVAPSVASASVKLARSLEDLPVVSEAFAAGEIGRAHAQVISRAAGEGFDEFEANVVEVAKRATPVELRHV